LLGESTIAVGIKSLEGTDDLVDVPEAVSELVEATLGCRAHEADKLRQADLTVLINVSKCKDNFGVLVGQSEAILQLLLADSAILVGINSLEAIDDCLLISKLSRDFLQHCARVGDHQADELDVVNSTRLIGIPQGKDGIDVGITKLGHNTLQLRASDVSIAVGIELAEGSLHLIQVAE